MPCSLWREFFGSGFRPSLLSIYAISSFLSWHLSLLSLRFRCLVRSKTFASLKLCWSSFSPQISMSSTTTSTPSMSSSISDIILWNMSYEQVNPKGKRLNMYLPNGVLKVQSLVLSESSSICQKPELASRTENTFMFGILVTTSLIVLVG